MQFVFAQVNAWFGLMSGGLIAQRRCAEGLAALGHTCHAIVRLCDAADDRGPQDGAAIGTTYQTRTALARRGVAVTELARGGRDDRADSGDRAQIDAIEFRLGGVRVRAIGGPYDAFCDHLDRHLRALKPDWIHVTDVDDGPPFLDICRARAAGRVVAHLHSVSHLPFGPQAMFPRDRRRAEALRGVRGAICPSAFGRDYVRRHGGIDAVALRYDTYARGPFGPRPTGAPFAPGRDFVTFINPCSVKGLPIFMELAAAMPEVAFAAVPTWGRKPAVVDALAARPNVTLLPPSDDIDDILSRTRVLLAPALWPETFGMTVVEAMQRGVPVVASDLAGHRESKLGVDYLIPTRPIELRHENGRVDKIIPEQNIAPWVETVARLMADPAEYDRVSRASSAAAAAFVDGLSWRPFADYLDALDAGRPLAP